MKKLILLSIVVFWTLNSCKKDEPVDLSYLCDKGDLWLTNKVDSFNPQHSADTFFFNQAAGYHSFIWTNSEVNKIQVDVLIKPDVGKTLLYKNQFIKEIKGLITNKVFTYNKKIDSILTITNNGNNYIIDIKPISVSITDGTSISYQELRACSLKMTDTIP